MKRVLIQDETSGLKAEVLPDYGGMISTISLKGVDVLRFNPDMVGMANMLSGGIPVLFPFCSKTENDVYTLVGKEYTMPFHGFVKDMTFSIERLCQNEVSIYTVPNEVIIKENYPFDFKLTLTYNVEGYSLFVKASIKNHCHTDMPYYIGWHPYFKTSRKEVVDFDFDMKYYRDYISGRQGRQKGKLDLTKTLDHVFWGIGKREVVLKNPADRYLARIFLDDKHSVVTVCTLFDDCVCIEPWTGMPNSINTGKMLNWVKSGTTDFCGFELQLELL